MAQVQVAGSLGEAVSLVASGVAIAISMGSLGVSLLTFLRDRPHLKVESTFGYFTPSIEEVILLAVINDGRHKEIVASIGFETADRKQVVIYRPESFPESALPWVLESSQSKFAAIPSESLRQQWREAQLQRMSGVFARTQSGRVYRGAASEAVRNFVSTRN